MAASKQSSALSRFLDPLIKLRHSLPEDASIDDLIIANVKKTVKTVCESDVSFAMQRRVPVVHSLVMVGLG